MKAARPDVVAAVFCGAVGLYDVLYVVFTIVGGPMIGPRVDVVFADFLVFHAAVRAWAEGKAMLIYQVGAFTEFQNALYFQDVAGKAYFRPFFYPPIWLLMLLPLGWLAVTKACAVFVAATAGLATVLVGRRDWSGWLAILLSPAAVWVIVAGQNTLLNVALFYGGMRLIPRAPAAAGILLGLLAYKPQLWVLVPVALIAARHWRVLAWTVGTAAAMSLASLAIFGVDLWQAFFDAAREGAAAPAANATFESIKVQMVSVLAAARIAGLPSSLAQALQLGIAVFSIGVVWMSFRRFGPSEARTALLASAIFLVSPYTLNYDLLLLMPAVVALFRIGVAQGFYPGERLIHPLLWLAPTLVIVLNTRGVPLVPLVIALFAAAAWRRQYLPAKVELRPAAAAR